jgi:hypothetical protein
MQERLEEVLIETMRRGQVSVCIGRNMLYRLPAKD